MKRQGKLTFADRIKIEIYINEGLKAIISKIKDIKRIDLSKLDGVVDEFDELLHKYQSITRMTDRRINKICTLLISRINKLENIINT